MAEFAYHNTKNTNTSYTPFELNCGYHLYVSYIKDIDPCFKSKSAEEFLTKLQELMLICHKNLYHAQELQKQVNDKGTKPKSYIPSDKILLNSKYIKTKQNWKLEAKFFGFF